MNLYLSTNSLFQDALRKKMQRVKFSHRVFTKLIKLKLLNEVEVLLLSEGNHIFAEVSITEATLLKVSMTSIIGSVS